jgi:hypothetical protein
MPMKITPTLVIGLGGTGKDTVLLLRKRLYESYGMIDGCLGLPSVQFLVIDTDQQIADSNASGNNQIPPQAALNNDSFLLLKISAPEFNNYANQPTSNPAISGWLSGGLLKKLGPSVVQQGAGQHRQIGRLFFFHNIDNIKNTINSKLQFLDRKMKRYDNWENKNNLNDLPEEYISDLNIYIVTSLSGGTGCGMFIDTAMLTHKLLKNPAFNGYTNKKINIICLMPPVNIEDSGSTFGGPGHVRANAFAALKEVEYISSASQFLNPLDYPERDHVFNVQWKSNQNNINPDDFYNLKVDGKPWDTFCLIDDTNLNNKSNSGYKSSVDMVAERLFMEMDNSDLPARLSQLHTNIVNATAQPKEIQIYVSNTTTRILTKKINVGYASFGLASYRFDRDKQRNLASHVLSKKILDYWLTIQNSNNFEFEEREQRVSKLFSPLSAGFEFIASDGNKKALQSELLKIRLLLLSKTPGFIKEHLEFGSEISIDGTLLDEVRVKVRAAVSMDADESLDTDPVETIQALIKEQDAFLAKPDGLNVQSNSDHGKVQKIINSNESAIADLIQQCLITIFKKMINEYGVNFANEMLDTARELFQRMLLKIQDEPDQNSIHDLTRLLDARGIWFFWMRNNASRWELERLKGNLEQNLITLYLAKTKPATEKILKKVIMLIGTRLEQSTLKGCIASFDDLIGNQPTTKSNIRSQISGEFSKINGPSSNGPKYSRAVNVITKMDEPSIASQVYKHLGGDGKFAREIENVSTLALQIYLKRPVSSLGELVVYLFKPFEDPINNILGPTDPNATIFRQLKDALQTASLEKLRKFKDEENITQHLQKDSLVDRVNDLASYSAPYIAPTSPNAAIGDFCRKFDQILAYAHSNNGPDNLNIDVALHAVPNLSLPIYPPGNGDKLLGNVAMDDDAVVMYQQAAGFPLSNSSKVHQWGIEYDRQSLIRYEFHIDKFFCMNAPEIRSDIYLLNTEAYLETIVECLYGVLFCYLRPQADGSSSFQGTVGGIDYLYTNRLGVNIHLPISWDRLLEHLLSPSAIMSDLRKDLKTKNNSWFTNIQLLPVIEKQNKLFKLWFALQYIWFDIRENSKASVEHPIQMVVSQMILPKIFQNPIYSNIISQHQDFNEISNSFNIAKTESSEYTHKDLNFMKDTDSHFAFHDSLKAMDIIVKKADELLVKPDAKMLQNPNFFPIWTIK